MEENIYYYYLFVLHMTMKNAEKVDHASMNSKKVSQYLSVHVFNSLFFAVFFIFID